MFARIVKEIMIMKKWFRKQFRANKNIFFAWIV